MNPNALQHFRIWPRAGVVVAFALALVVYGQPAHGQTDHNLHRAADDATDGSLDDQITELRAQVARLQARLDQGHQANAASSHSDTGGGMGSMKGKAGMQGMSMKGTEGMPKMDMMGGMQGKDQSPMQGSSMQGMGMMGMEGMQMMGRMGKKGSGPPPMIQSALPAFPGSSHLYHIGATGYFLDHTQHITLNRDQQTTLNQIKERVLLAQATTNRQIEQAEQELWVLTGTDGPDVRTIEAKVREIEKLKGDQRLGFIHAVGEAARVLTDEQIEVLVGEKGSTEQQAATSQPAHTSH